MTQERYKYWLGRHNWLGRTLHDERERDTLEHLAAQNPSFQPLLDQARECARQGRPITFDGGITSPVENHKTNNTMTELLKAIRAELIDPIVAAINNLAASLGNAPVPTAPAQTPEPAPKKERKVKPTPEMSASEDPPAAAAETPPATTSVAAEAPAAPAAEAPAAEAPAAEAPAADAGHGITFEDIKAHVESIRSMPDAQEKRERIKKFLNKECGGAQSTAECDPQYYPKLLKGLQKLGATDTRKANDEDI